MESNGGSGRAHGKKKKSKRWPSATAAASSSSSASRGDALGDALFGGGGRVRVVGGAKRRRGGNDDSAGSTSASSSSSARSQEEGGTDATAPTAAGGVGDEDEVTSALLASLGSTLASTSAYEAGVLRDVTAGSAPTLTGMGFPDLRPLAPSHRPNADARDRRRGGGVRNGDVDLPHVLTALSRTRSALSDLEGGHGEGLDTREANVLRMKAQILLSWCRDVADPIPGRGDGTAGIDSRAELLAERRRSAALVAGTGTGGDGDDDGGGKRGASSLDGMASADAASSAPAPARRKRPRGGVLSAAERLDRAKRGLPLDDDEGDDEEGGVQITSKSANAAFGKQALADAATARSRGRRVGIMDRRRMLAGGVGDGDGDGGEAGEDREDREKLRRWRMKRREERRRRREERRRRWLARRSGFRDLGEDEEDDVGEADGVDAKEGRIDAPQEDDGEEAEWSEEGQQQEQHKKEEARESPDEVAAATAEQAETSSASAQVEAAPDQAPAEQDGETRPPSSSSAPAAATSATGLASPSTAAREVVCPLCGETLEVDGGDVDSVLSAHVDECQTRRRSARTATRRSTRSGRAAPASYAEVDEEGDDGDGDGDRDDFVPPPAGGNDGGVGDDDDDDDDDRDGSDHGDSKPAAAAAPARGRSARGGPRPTEAGAPGPKRASAPTTRVAAARVTAARSSGAGGEDPPPRRRRTSSAAARPAPAAPPPPARDDMDLLDYEDRVDSWIISGLEEMRDTSDVRDAAEKPPGAARYPGGLVLPGWANDRLFPYQRAGVRWMWELHRQAAGGIVGDEMGLGKTVQVSAFLGAMARGRMLDSVLVVAPATVLAHWLGELASWAPGLRRVLVHRSGDSAGDGSAGGGARREVSGSLLSGLERWLRRARRECVNERISAAGEYLGDHEVDGDDREEDEEDDTFCGTGYVVVTTFENVRRFADTWTMHHWSYVVMDEGQKIRNPDADVTLACKRLRTPHRLLLSGTPIQNDLRELWSLFDFVFPGRLGTLPAFEAEFAEPIRKGGYSNASPMQVQLAYRCALVLRDIIDPYLLRRQKKDIDEVKRMPGKTEQVLFCRLSDRQRSLYEAYLESDEVRRIMQGSAQSFRAITVLRKICNHPDLVCGPGLSSFSSFIKNGGAVDEGDVGTASSEEYSDHDVTDDPEEMTGVERSGKLTVLAKILPLWHKQGHRVLIFCQWKKMLNIIQRFTEDNGWKFARMDGNTNVGSRQQLVDRFNSDKSYFGMLLTTKTGGVGLNLTGADRILLYDPDWNPQTDAQARERAYRFGQKNAVTVYRLITAGTIEEKIYHRQIFKTAISNQVLQDPRQRRLFSQKDLKNLFTLRADVDSIAGGGDGLTETGQLTKGAGVINPGDVEMSPNESGNEDANDNGSTLGTVLRSKGLAAVFDHNFVDDASKKRNKTAVEMEEYARKVARKAAKAIQESSAGQDVFSPTWTGVTDTQHGQLPGFSSASISGSDRGGSRKRSVRFSVSNGTKPNSEQTFGGSSSAGVVVSREGARGKSSTSVLANLQKRRHQIASSGNEHHGSDVVDADVSVYTRLMKRMRQFLVQYRRNSRNGPTTAELLDEFSNIPNIDAAIFRRILNTLAVVEGGRWQLKEE